MKIVISNPPNFEKILKAGLNPGKRTIFTYGDTIYNPNANYIDPALMKHEETHSKQQRYDPEEWWNEYLTNKYFRVISEVEAYRVQYREMEKLMKDELSRFLQIIAEDLSGETYGNILSFQQAKERIENASNKNTK